MGVIDTTAQANFSQRNFANGELVFRCVECWDSLITLDLYGPNSCKPCAAGPASPAATKIGQVVIDRIERAKSIDRSMLNAARALANATIETPIPGEILQRHLGCDRRRLALLTQRLCDEWKLPAIASRHQPQGYYIAVTADQLDTWGRVIRAQAISELVRYHSLKKACYPELTGQQSIDFINQISSELQEAIR